MGEGTFAETRGNDENAPKTAALFRRERDSVLEPFALKSYIPCFRLGGYRESLFGTLDHSYIAR
jgi:hypothetical protein